MKKINVITLGCSKNTVDSEHLMARLAAAVTSALRQRPHRRQGRRDQHLRIHRRRQAGVDRHDPAGRRGQERRQDRTAVRRRLPLGTLCRRAAARNCPKWTNSSAPARGTASSGRWVRRGPALETERHLTTPKHYAYLKISEGCNWKCGYCAIPLIRGGHVSVPMERLEEEARKLAAGGVRKLIVIAQDTTYYGSTSTADGCWPNCFAGCAASEASSGYACTTPTPRHSPTR